MYYSFDIDVVNQYMYLKIGKSNKKMNIRLVQIALEQTFSSDDKRRKELKIKKNFS
jgi:hypothetical protein